MTDPTSNAPRAAEATERPWTKRRALRPVDGEYDYAIQATVDGKLQIIAETFGRSATTIFPNAEANAALIVTAVNERDTLLSDLASSRSRIAELEGAVSGALRLFETIQTQDMTLSIVGRLNQMIVRLRALSKGEG